MERQHGDQMEVQTFLTLDKNNLNRKKIIDKFLKEGDFYSGEVIRVQEKIEKRLSVENGEEKLIEDNSINS